MLSFMPSDSEAPLGQGSPQLELSKCLCGPRLHCVGTLYKQKQRVRFSSVILPRSYTITRMKRENSLYCMRSKNLEFSLSCDQVPYLYPPPIQYLCTLAKKEVQPERGAWTNVGWIPWMLIAVLFGFGCETSYIVPGYQEKKEKE